METLTILLSIIFLVFGILQIILFFKIWAMTNNVKKIKEIIQPNRVSIIRDILKGKDVKDALFDSMFDETYKACRDGNFYDSNPLITIAEKYQALYSRAGLEYPSQFLNITCPKDFWDLIEIQSTNKAEK